MKNVAVINMADYGSTGKIAIGLHEYLLSNGYNSYFCYCRGNSPFDSRFLRFQSMFGMRIHAFLTRITGRQGCFSYFATKQLLKTFDKLRIDTIFGECLHGYYINEKLLFNYIAKKGIKFIYVVIDEYPYLGKCWNSNGCERYLIGCGRCPQKKIYPASYFLDGSKHIFKNKAELYPKLKGAVFAGPEYVMTNASKSPLMKGIQTAIVDEGINLEYYYPRETVELREQLGIPDDKVIIFSTASFYNTKGGLYFLELAKRLETDKRFIFIHAGSKNEPEVKPSNYFFAGFVPNEMLPVYYSMADLFVFTSYQDCMPNACLESLACGTPLVCFNISGMPFLAGSDLEFLVKPRDINDLERVVLEHAKKKDQGIITKCRDYAVKRYDRNLYFKKLVECANDDNKNEDLEE